MEEHVWVVTGPIAHYGKIADGHTETQRVIPEEMTSLLDWIKPLPSPTPHPPTSNFPAAKSVQEALSNLVSKLPFMGVTDINKNIRLTREWGDKKGRVKVHLDGQQDGHI